MGTAAPTATNMGIRLMNTDSPRANSDLLTMAQWLSPSFPVGAFAYSHGLETAVHDGQVRTAKDLSLWLNDVLRHGSGWSDAVLLSIAYSASSAEELTDIDETARAFQSSFERLREAERMGAAFAKVTRDVWSLDVPDCLYSVAIGRAAGLKGINLVEVLGLYLHSFASNMVSAAIRLVPLGQTEGQTVLAGLSPLCAELAGKAQGASSNDLSNSANLSDIAAMRHETLEQRLFQS